MLYIDRNHHHTQRQAAMEKLIVVRYIEHNDHEGETWIRLKCLPYTYENYERVTKYVQKLNGGDESDEYSGNTFNVNCEVISGDDSYIFGYINGLKSADMYYHLGNYKPSITVKVYTNGEMLPHEDALATGAHLNVYKHFGEHYIDEEKIGEN